MRVSDLVKSFEEQIALSPKSLSPRSTATGGGRRADDTSIPKSPRLVEQEPRDDQKEEEAKLAGGNQVSQMPGEHNNELWDDAKEHASASKGERQESTPQHQESRDEQSISEVIICQTSELTDEFYVEEALIMPDGRQHPVEHHHHDREALQELLSEPRLLESESSGDTDIKTKYTELTDEQRGNEIHMIGTEIVSPHAHHLSKPCVPKKHSDEASLHTRSSVLTDEALAVETESKVMLPVERQAEHFTFNLGEKEAVPQAHAQSRNDSEPRPNQDATRLCESEYETSNDVISTPDQSKQTSSRERDPIEHLDQPLEGESYLTSEREVSLESERLEMADRESRDTDDVVALHSGNRGRATLETRDPNDGIAHSESDYVKAKDSDRVDIKQLFLEMEQSMDVRFRRLEETCQQIPVIMEQLQQHLDETTEQQQDSGAQEQDTTRVATMPKIALNIASAESNTTDASIMASFPELQAYVNQLEWATAHAIADALEEDKCTHVIDAAVEEEIPSDEERDALYQEEDEDGVSKFRFSQQIRINASTQSSEDASLSRETPSNDETSNSQPVLAFSCPGMTAIELFPFDPAKDMEQPNTFIEEQHMSLHKACLVELPCCGNPP